MAKAQPSSPFSQIEPRVAIRAGVGITIIVAVGISALAGVGMTVLVFLTAALLGAILLVWHSLRTLAGDADVDPALELAAATRVPPELADKKRRALRALKDLEQEHDLGKIDDADYKVLDADYREQAKEVIREMDDSIAPFREKAEALVREHLDKHPVDKVAKEEPAEHEDDALECPKCETDNDADAAFCKKCGEKLA